MKIETFVTENVNVLMLSDDELKSVKDALHLYHEKLSDDMKLIEKNTGKDSPMHREITELTIEVEFMCQELEIEGYEFS